jgi:hypothetical protein
MQDIIEIILDKVHRDNLNIFNDLRFFLDKPRLMTFLINDNHGLPEMHRYYDPLYSNAYVRRVGRNQEISITIKLESNEDFSKYDREVIMKKSGFAKFKYYDGSFDWREVKIKEPEQRLRRDANLGVKFKCLTYPCKNLF